MSPIDTWLRNGWAADAPAARRAEGHRFRAYEAEDKKREQDAAASGRIGRHLGGSPVRRAADWRADRLTVQNSTFTDAGTGASLIESCHATFSGTTFFDFAVNGIHAIGANHLNVRDNLFFDGERGMHILASDRAHLKDNDLVDLRNDGIVIEHSDDAYVAGNTFGSFDLGIWRRYKWSVLGDACHGGPARQRLGSTVDDGEGPL